MHRLHVTVVIAPIRARHLLLVGLGLLAILLSGCETVHRYSFTYRLWDTDDFRKFSEPAPNPNLALFENGNHDEILVQYDALSEKHSTVKRRSYYLATNQERIDAGKAPEFEERVVNEQFNPIRVFELTPVEGLPETLPCAVVSSQGRAFTLHRSPNETHTYDLPVYPETSGTALRIALTPFAVVGDTVMVGGVAAVVGFLLWVQGGAPH